MISWFIDLLLDLLIDWLEGVYGADHLLSTLWFMFGVTPWIMTGKLWSGGGLITVQKFFRPSLLTSFLDDFFTNTSLTRYKKWLTNWLTLWISVSLTYWLTESLTHWLTDLLNFLFSDLLTHWLTDSLTRFLTVSLTHNKVGVWRSSRMELWALPSILSKSSGY